jgi:hypothetical protein
MAIINSGKILTSGLITWDVITPESGTQLKINKVEISNKNGGDMEIGWGEELPIIVGKYVTAGATFTVHNFANGAMTLAAGQELAIIAPKKFDALFINTSTNSSGASTIGVYNGSNLTTQTFTATYGTVSMAAGDPSMVVAPKPLWVVGGISGYPTSYVAVTGTGVGAVITDVKVGRIIDYVSVVADGNHAVREYSIEPLTLMKPEGLFVHTSSISQTTSIATIDYQQV